MFWKVWTEENIEEIYPKWKIYFLYNSRLYSINLELDILYIYMPNFNYLHLTWLFYTSLKCLLSKSQLLIIISFFYSFYSFKSLHLYEQLKSLHQEHIRSGHIVGWALWLKFFLFFGRKSMHTQKYILVEKFGETDGKWVPYTAIYGIEQSKVFALVEKWINSNCGTDVHCLASCLITVCLSGLLI